jgi:two-component system CheB/CheR fusion protein
MSSANHPAPASVVEGDNEFERLLRHLSRSRGVDFTGYKRPSLLRRLRRRMTIVSIMEFGRYIEYLDTHPEEFDHLFNALLINVTAFFRDGAPWEVLRTDLIPPLIEARGPDEPIRIWSAGCASGEETYTVAMLFAEALGAEAFARRVRIYATDVDNDALAEARAAIYPRARVKDIPAALVDRYFEEHDDRFALCPGLRRAVIFGRHDLLRDPPISRVSLLVCRNTLMYFNPGTQSQILSRFHYAPADDGLLLLGKAKRC